MMTEHQRVVVLLGCGAAKRDRGWWGPLVELYTGNLYRARLAHAQSLGGPHWILSAFHGPRHPDYLSSWYDRTLDDRDARAWYNGVCRSTFLAHTSPGDHLVILAGRRYFEEWSGELERRGRSIETPLAGLGIGEQLAWLAARFSTTNEAPQG